MPTEPFWMEIAKQVPSLAALIGLVGIFVWCLKDILSRFEVMEGRWADTIEGINDSNQAAQKVLADRTDHTLGHVSKVLDRNTEALAKNSAVLDHAINRLGMKNGSTN